MPSITYIDDSRSEFDGHSYAKPTADNEAPEPPTRYDGDFEFSEKPEGNHSQFSRLPDFDSARRLIAISQILAVVSLIIGGVVLSAVAIVLAVIGYKRALENAVLPSEYQMPWKLLKRSATIAIVVSALAFCANLVALIVVYPMVLQAVQTGDYSALLPMGSQLDASGNGSNSSTWG